MGLPACPVRFRGWGRTWRSAAASRRPCRRSPVTGAASRCRGRDRRSAGPPRPTGVGRGHQVADLDVIRQRLEAVGEARRHVEHRAGSRRRARTPRGAGRSATPARRSTITSRMAPRTQRTQLRLGMGRPLEVHAAHGALLAPRPRCSAGRRPVQPCALELVRQHGAARTSPARRRALEVDEPGVLQASSRERSCGQSRLAAAAKRGRPARRRGVDEPPLRHHRRRRR